MENKGKVLVVDDQPVNVEVLGTQLSAAGYEVIRAYSGEEALALAAETKPDIILLDILMPGLSGYDVTARIKGDPALQSTPVVLITVLEGVDDKVQGLNAGADDFLSRPVNPLELQARIRSLVKLKRLQDELAQKNRETPPSPGPLTEEKPAAKKTILIVEDGNAAALFTRTIVEKAGYESVLAKNGTEAKAILSKAIPDLILLDLLLPDADGLELLREIRSFPAMDQTPVIIVSGLSDLETKVKGIETGADDYLVKPFNALEMVARIRANLRKTEISHKLRSDLNIAVTQAMTDTLTQLYNRNYFNINVEREIAAAKRYGRLFSLLMLDIDYFKSINDTFGHLAGDSVLKELGVILKDKVRAGDIAVRYGGEEFVLLLQETGIKGALTAAENIRRKVEQHHFSNIQDAMITVSIGVADYNPADGDMDTIITKADRALYEAKQAGRNRVMALSSAVETGKLQQM
jgi:two-component system, cell cycle response regulator